MNKLVVLMSLIMVIASVGCNKTEPAKQVRKTAEPAQQSAYAFTVQTLDGKSVSLADYKGKVLLLNFWDTWCPPCRAEIPDFIDLYREYNSKGFEILGVAGGRAGINAVKEFVDQYGINYPVALANQQIFNGYGGITSIPTTFIIDKDGNINQKIVGLRPRNYFEAVINELLQD